MNFTALSVIQPWPWLILRPDIVGAPARQVARAAGLIKDVENRSEHYHELAAPGWVLLHASSFRLAKWDYQRSAFGALLLGVDVPLRDNLPYGAVVGAMRLTDKVVAKRSRWFVGPVGYVIADSVPFAEPIVCDGAPKFFMLPPSSGAGVGGEELSELLVAAVRAAGLAAEFRVEAFGS